jgi:hypothetical protein
MGQGTSREEKSFNFMLHRYVTSDPSHKLLESIRYWKKYTDLKEYIPIDFQDKKDVNEKYKEYKKGTTGKKYVIVVSQENLRTKISNEYCLINPEYEGEICDDYYTQHCNESSPNARLDCTKHNEKIANVIATQKNNDRYIKKNNTKKKQIETELKANTKPKNNSKKAKTTATEDKETEYDDSIIAIIKDFLKEDEKIVFFDEVHQGRWFI